MTRNFTIVAALVVVTASLAGGVRTRTTQRRIIDLNAANSNQSAGAEKYEAAKIESDYHEAISTVEEKYAGDIDYEKATQAAIQGMLFTLDPHSVFFSTTEFRKLKEDQASSFYGIGVQIQRHDDGVYIQSVVEGTPASRAGLRFGDRIVEVDGKDARDWSSDEVSKNVRGVRGEAVKLKVERPSEEAAVNVKIVRDSVPLPSIRNAFMLSPGTGYVGLVGGFQHTTDDELREAIAGLKKDGGMRQMILDLRNNPGGLLDQAIDVSSEFLPRDKVIVSVKGRSEYHDPAIYKSNGSDPEELPLVVLINRNTASASEIVAGAIQDHGRGLVVGETSFGKGLVQHVFQLPFNTGLTLTTARYYTPYGRSLQRDYSSGSLYDYYVRHDQNDNQQPIQPGQPSPNESVPPQSLNAPAFRTAAGRVFYGGGGITPDIEARALTATPLRGRIMEAAFQFTRILAAGKIPGLESYRVDKVEYGHAPKATDYVINDRVLEAFRNYLRKDQGQRLQVTQIETDLDFVKLRLRQEIITAAFGADAGQRVLLESDPQALRAIGVLPDAKRLAESVRNGTPLSLNFKPASHSTLLPFLPGIEELDEILI
jgi:carboxyl-terminal processing protease